MRSTDSVITSSYSTRVKKYQTLDRFLMYPCKHRDCMLLLTVSKAEFRSQFPYLDKLQNIGFIPWLESQSDCQKFNILCWVVNTHANKDGFHPTNLVCLLPCIQEGSLLSVPRDSEESSSSKSQADNFSLAISQSHSVSRVAKAEFVQAMVAPQQIRCVGRAVSA